jgi:AcrR family transcriptional regulator
VTGRRTGRRPGPNTTRADILAAARALFAERGYEATTIRAVAARADVDPALVHRLFGPKEALLKACLWLPFDPNLLTKTITGTSGDEGAALVRTALHIWANPLIQQHLKTMLRVGVSHEIAAAALREVLTRQILAALAERIPDRPEFRAALVASQMSGLALTRYVIELEPISDSDTERLVAAIAPTIQRYLFGDIDH